MPYPAGHRTEVKKKIVSSARRLFNRHGFEKVSLDQIMEGAGLTRGGFYSYFGSKSDLYAEVLGCFFTDAEWKSCWDGVDVDLKSTDVGRQVVRAYLSIQHFEDVENSCPMVALPTDVTRSGTTAKRTFETVFAAMSACSSGVCMRAAEIAVPLRKPWPLCAWAAWLSPAPWRIAVPPITSVTHACASPSPSVAGIPENRADRKSSEQSGSNIA
jgi:AcrR family transcriptional regulator